MPLRLPRPDTQVGCGETHDFPEKTGPSDRLAPLMHHGGANAPHHDADLQALIDGWQSIPDQVRSFILAPFQAWRVGTGHDSSTPSINAGPRFPGRKRPAKAFPRSGVLCRSTPDPFDAPDCV